jgi:hypothetical protein
MARRSLLIGLLALVAASARGQTFGEPDTDLEIRLVTDADDPPGLYAFLTTTSVYPCAGYRMRTTVTRERDTISVRIGGFVQPVPCVSGMDEARGSVYLGNPAYGTYMLRFVYRGSADLYRMVCINRIPAVAALRSHFTTVHY